MIFAICLVALLFFIGLALDAGVIYVNYGQLKRAVDAAAVSAAQEFKRRGTDNYTRMLERIRLAALETIALQGMNTNPTVLELNVYVCNDANGNRLASLQTTVPQFYALCPDTTIAGQSRSKLVWVEAKQYTPFYFLHLLGFSGITLKTNSVGEAAPVDLVIVIDTSESMASEPNGAYPYNGQDFDPDDYTSGCNPGTSHPNTCQPLKSAKDAAKALVATMMDGYDRVSIVNFDTVAVATTLSFNLTDVNTAIDNLRLHDDPPAARLWGNWFPGGSFGRVNPVNPEDRDGDGRDADPARPCTLNNTRWDTTQDPYGWGGVPCDDDNVLDAFDWDMSGSYTTADTTLAAQYLANHDPDGAGPLKASFSLASTCTGCGIRVGSNVLKSTGRPGALWVMVFLTDGTTNLSDTYGPSGTPGVGDTPRSMSTWTSVTGWTSFPNGFCTGYYGTTTPQFWNKGCLDQSNTVRYCLYTDQSMCPPGTTRHTGTPQYSVYDYAMDMVDEAALLKSTRATERRGNNITIYTIGLGEAVTPASPPATLPTGERLMRYMAAVGDDGDRTTDPCNGIAVKTNCGNYYYAPQGSALLTIFEDIASRIYTRISQ